MVDDKKNADRGKRLESLLDAINKNLGVDAYIARENPAPSSSLLGSDSSNKNQEYIAIDLGNLTQEEAKKVETAFRTKLVAGGHAAAMPSDLNVQKIGDKDNQYPLLDAEYAAKPVKAELLSQFFSDQKTAFNGIIPQSSRDAYVSDAEHRLDALVEPLTDANLTRGIKYKLSENLDADVRYDDGSARLSLAFSTMDEAKKFKDELTSVAGLANAAKLDIKIAVTENGQHAVTFLAEPLVGQNLGDTSSIYKLINSNTASQKLKEVIPASVHDKYTTQAESDTERNQKETERSEKERRLSHYVAQAQNFFGNRVRLKQNGGVLYVTLPDGEDAGNYVEEVHKVLTETGIPAEKFSKDNIYHMKIGAWDSFSLNLEKIEKYDAEYGGGAFFQKMEKAKEKLKKGSDKKETGQLDNPMDKARRAAQVVFADNPEAAKLLSPTPEDAYDFLNARKPATIGGHTPV